MSLHVRLTAVAAPAARRRRSGGGTPPPPARTCEALESRRLLAFAPAVPEFPVNTTTAGNQSWSGIGLNQTGAGVITWESAGQDGDAGGIYARRFAADGTAVGSEFRVNTYTAGNQEKPVIAMAPDGRYVVAWNEYGGTGVHAQRFDAAGQKVGEPFRVTSSTSGGSGYEAAVAIDDDGKFAIAYSGVGTASSNRGVFLRRYAADGTPFGAAAERVTPEGATLPGEPAVAMHNGNTIVVWEEVPSGFSSDVYGRIFPAGAGSTPGARFTVNASPGFSQSQPKVETDNAGNFVVAWTAEAGYDGSGNGVYARRFSATGAPLGGDIPVNTRTSGDQTSPALAVTGDGSFAVAFHGPGDAGTFNGIWMRTFTAAGVAEQTADVLVNAPHPDHQYVPSAEVSGDGTRLLVAWHSWNQDGSGTGIYAAGFSSASLGIVSTVVFDDLNANGTQDSGEGLRANQVIYADLDEDGRRDGNEPVATYNANGTHTMSLAPGRYSIRLELAPGVHRTSPGMVVSGSIPVDVTGGGTASVRFGALTIPGVIAGRVVHDQNSDGTFQPAEPGLAGRTVFLDTDRDGVVDAGETSVTTDASGGYAFGNLTAGEYWVRVLPPAGWYPTIASVRIITWSASGVIGVDFGISNTPLSIRGTVFDDLDADGVLDPNEPAFVAGRTVYIDDNSNAHLDPGERSFTTNVDGFAFNNLTPGTYKLRLVKPLNRQQTLPANDDEYTLKLPDSTGAPSHYVYFGVADVGDVAGRVFVDTDPRPGTPVTLVGGRTVYLDTNNNGVLDAGEPTRVSSGSGTFKFDNLPPGDYVVRQVLPAGWIQTNPPRNAARTGHVDGFWSLNTADFSSFQQAGGAIVGGRVFGDADGDGQDDRGAGPADAGWTVLLDLDRDGVQDAGEPTSVTDSQGWFVFPNAPGGIHHLRLLPRTGYEIAPPTANPVIADVPVGQAAYDAGFGYRVVTPPEISVSLNGQPFADGATADFGTADFGASPAPTLTFTITNTGGQTLTLQPAVTIPGVTILDPVASSLAPGASDTFVIRLDTNVAGRRSGTITFANDDANENPYDIVIAGAVRGASIGGTVFDDTDADGVRDPGEAGIGNELVDLRDLAGNLVARKNAAADGSYLFDMLPAGSYVVATNIFKHRTTPFSLEPVAVTATQVVTGRDIGHAAVTGPGVAGWVYRDADADGTYEPGEQPVAGWRVFLDTDADGAFDAGEEFALTNGAGHYVIDEQYFNPSRRVVVEPPAGFRCTSPADGTRTVQIGNGVVNGQNFGVEPVPVTPVTLRAAADAYVRDGSSATTNFGTATELHLKKGTSAGLTREFYLKFDLSGVSSVGSAVLRLNGVIHHATQTARVAVYPVSNTTWAQDTINWNTRPAAGATALATQTVATATAKWYEWDVSGYLASEKAAGRNTVTLLVRSLDVTDPFMIFSSDEAASNGPALVVTPAAVVPTLPAWLAPGSAATWDAGTKALTVTGAVTIVGDPGPDAPVITANGPAAVVTFSPSPGRAVHIGGLTLTGGATATLASVTTSSSTSAAVRSSGGKLTGSKAKSQLTSAAVRTAANSRVLVIDGNTFAIDANSTLDIADNNLILNYSGASPAAGVEGMVKAGFNGGDWLGKRITSSSTNANRSFALGASDNSRLAIPFNSTRLFAGEAVDTTAVLVKFTHRVDLDLDGVITTNDATVFNSNYSEGGAARWGVGDVDFDGLFSTNDATIFNSFYNESLGAV